MKKVGRPRKYGHEIRRQMSLEAKAQRRLAHAMEVGKPPHKGRYVLHQAHVLAWKKNAVNIQTRSAKQSMHAIVVKQVDAWAFRAHVSAWKKACPAAVWVHRYRTDVEFNMREKMRARMRKVLAADMRLGRDMSSNVKARRWPEQWTLALGYTLDELIKHLHRTLPKRMTWSDFLAGSLHIDHIVPRASFDCTDPADLRACWALSNLRLLPASDNQRKGAAKLVLL